MVLKVVVRGDPKARPKSAERAGQTCAALGIVRDLETDETTHTRLYLHWCLSGASQGRTDCVCDVFRISTP